MKLLPAGTRFPLSFEYMVLEKGLSANITEYFVVALSALESGKIPIGKRKGGVSADVMQKTGVYTSMT